MKKAVHFKPLKQFDLGFSILYSTTKSASEETIKRSGNFADEIAIIKLYNYCVSIYSV